MKFLMVVFYVVFVTMSAFAQNSIEKGVEKSEFSGTWWLLVNEGTYRGKPDDKVILEITVNGEELKIRKSSEIGNRRKTTYDLILYADKRGERNVAPGFGFERDGFYEIKSTTNWGRGKFMRAYRQNAGIGQFEIAVREEYHLSKDGSKLIVDSFAQSDLPIPERVKKTKLVFERKN